MERQEVKAHRAGLALDHAHSRLGAGVGAEREQGNPRRNFAGLEAFQTQTVGRSQGS